MAKCSEVSYVTPIVPRQLRLDTTTFCNATCLSCHRHLSQRRGRMPDELLSKILDDVGKWHPSLNEIIPVNYGEFFSLHDWYEILEQIAVKLPYTQIVIPTNGSLIKDKVVKLCHIPNVRIINFSVNGYFDETYENFMGLKAKTIGEIREAISQIKILRPDIKIWVSMVFDPEYQTDLERDMFQSYWMPFATTWLLPAASAGRPSKKPVQPVTLPCRSLFSDIVVGFDGKLSSCCFDPSFSAFDLGYYSGDLKKDWCSPQFEQFRQIHNSHKRSEIDLCSRCTFA